MSVFHGVFVTFARDAFSLSEQINMKAKGVGERNVEQKTITGKGFSSGKMLLAELKRLTIELLQAPVSQHQARQQGVMMDDVRYLVTPRKSSSRSALISFIVVMV